jgi:hypothetical protein
MQMIRQNDVFADLPMIGRLPRFDQKLSHPRSGKERLLPLWGRYKHIQALRATPLQRFFGGSLVAIGDSRSRVSNRYPPWRGAARSSPGTHYQQPAYFTLLVPPVLEELAIVCVTKIVDSSKSLRRCDFSQTGPIHPVKPQLPGTADNPGKIGKPRDVAFPCCPKVR